MSTAGAGVKGHRLVERAAADATLALLRPSIPEHGIHDHAHDEMHAVLLLSGGYVSRARGMPEVCTVPALVFNPPGTEHRDRFRSRHGLFLTVALPALRYREYGHGATPAAPLRLGPRAMAGGHALLHELLHWDAGSPLAVEGLLAELIGHADAAADAPADPPVLARAFECLHDAQAWPSIGELAAAAGVHPVYLARVFRRATGSTPAAYLRRLRALQALDWLARGHTAAVAAQRSGHVDASHLRRALRREFGIAPGGFRTLAGCARTR